MCGYHPILLVQLLKGDEYINVETPSKLLERMQEVWHQAHAQMEIEVAIKKSYYSKKHRAI